MTRDELSALARRHGHAVEWVDVGGSAGPVRVAHCSNPGCQVKLTDRGGPNLMGPGVYRSCPSRGESRLTNAELRR